MRPLRTTAEERTGAKSILDYGKTSLTELGDAGGATLDIIAGICWRKVNPRSLAIVWTTRSASCRSKASTVWTDVAIFGRHKGSR